MKRKLADSSAVINRYLVLQVIRCAVGTLMGMALIVEVLLQIRIWHQTGFLFF